MHSTWSLRLFPYLRNNFVCDLLSIPEEHPGILTFSWWHLFYVNLQRIFCVLLSFPISWFKSSPIKAVSLRLCQAYRTVSNIYDIFRLQLLLLTKQFSYVMYWFILYISTRFLVIYFSYRVSYNVQLTRQTDKATVQLKRNSQNLFFPCSPKSFICCRKVLKICSGLIPILSV